MSIYFNVHPLIIAFSLGLTFVGERRILTCSVFCVFFWNFFVNCIPSNVSYIFAILFLMEILVVTVNSLYIKYLRMFIQFVSIATFLCKNTFFCSYCIIIFIKKDGKTGNNICFGWLTGSSRINDVIIEARSPLSRTYEREDVIRF